ncbi:MAG: phosphatase PAP2 family protein [Gammaproteobacteria bacterium]|nr:phosphatase PAP2 family protein [Gammaproteobacteria bacterium]
MMKFIFKNYWFIFLTVIAALAIWLTKTNHSLFFYVNSHHNLLSDATLNAINFITWFDSGILPIALITITLLFRRDKLLNVILLIVTYMIVFSLLKFVFHEARPYIQYNPQDFYWSSSTPQENSKDAYRSFPSGHTGNTAIFVFALSYLFAYQRFWLSSFLLLPLALTMLVRIGTGWHFPLDVLCAALFAFILVEFTMRLPLKTPKIFIKNSFKVKIMQACCFFMKKCALYNKEKVNSKSRRVD